MFVHLAQDYVSQRHCILYLELIVLMFLKLIDVSKTPEFLIIAIDIVIILLAYGLFYPQFAGNQFKKIAMFDAIITALLLAIVGVQYWDSGYEFNLLIAKVNWFWFTFLSFSVLEIPVMQWYFKKHHVKIKE